MLKLNFKEKYNIVHIGNEIGSYLIGGLGTYMNELYRYKRDDMGFVYLSFQDQNNLDSEKFPGQEDILAIERDEYRIIENLDFEILVVHFYELDFCITDELLKDIKIAYVVHSVPTPEPPPKSNPFLGYDKLKEKFVRICDCATVIICVSEAEKKKLSKIFPHYAEKIRVVHNGITIEKKPEVNTNYRKSRKVFGFIGRMDNRKGIYECVKAFKDIDAELRLACPFNDTEYFYRISEYIEAAGIKDKITFYGWCAGQRKENFFKFLDALIIPSLYEPFGYVALEGMQHGIPLISSNNGGLDEILEGYKYKYAPYEDGALEAQIRAFMEDSETEIDQQVKIMLENLKRFKAENMVEKYNEIWDELLEEK